MQDRVGTVGGWTVPVIEATTVVGLRGLLWASFVSVSCLSSHCYVSVSLTRCVGHSASTVSQCCFLMSAVETLLRWPSSPVTVLSTGHDRLLLSVTPELGHTPNCLCGVAPQTPEHTLQSCSLHREGRTRGRVGWACVCVCGGGGGVAAWNRPTTTCIHPALLFPAHRRQGPGQAAGSDGGAGMGEVLCGTAPHPLEHTLEPHNHLNTPWSPT